MGKTIIKEGSPVLRLFVWVSLFLLCEGSPLGGQNLPSPISLSPDRSSQVRNLALNRAAYHSSCSGFDYYSSFGIRRKHSYSGRYCLFE